MENPFLLDIADKDQYTLEDYAEMERQLEACKLRLDPLLRSLYPEGKMTTPYTDIYRRCSQGVRQKLLDDSGILPVPQLFTVGRGGDNCFVCCTPFGSDRCLASKTVLESLEKVGFDGHFLLMNGGFPCPTGVEMKYAGVPYCFKIFMMLEAKKRGFEKVIWIDAACYAVNNPAYLFDCLGKGDAAVFRSFMANLFQPNTCENIVLPSTISLLSQLVGGRNIRNDVNVNSIVFGLNLGSPVILKWVSEYYDMVRFGLPFLSSFPEEIVFTTLFNKPEYCRILHSVPDMKHLYIHEAYLPFEEAARRGYFFVQRKY